MIEYLNDDCLIHIFQYLNLRDQVNVTTVHERFRTLIVENIWRSKYHIFGYIRHGRELKIEEYKIFYRLMAPHITKLTLIRIQSRRKKSDLEYIDPEFDFYFSFYYPKLRILHCWETIAFDDYLKVVVQTCPKLEVLRLRSFVTGDHLADIPNLRELYISSYEPLNPIHFEKLFQNQKILRVKFELEERNQHEMENVLNTILPKITELRYYDDKADIFTFSTHLLKKLEILYLDEYKRFKNFANSLHTLKELHLNSKIPMNCLFELIDNNVHLEQIYFSSNFGNMEYLRELMCELSDHMQQKLERQVLIVHTETKVNWTQNSVNKLQQLVEHYDVQQGYPKSAIKIKAFHNCAIGYSLLTSRTGFEFALNWD